MPCIPDSVTTLGPRTVFEHCYKLESVVYSNGLTYVSGSMFSYCEALKSIVIPESVTSIYDGAFENCKRLESVLILSENVNIEEGAFSKAAAKCVFYGHPGSAVEAFAKANGFEFESLHVLTESVTEPVTEPATDAVTKETDTLPPSDTRDKDNNGAAVTGACIGAAVGAVIAAVAFAMKNKKK